jgi:outer membrane protein assembly factor BamD
MKMKTIKKRAILFLGLVFGISPFMLFSGCAKSVRQAEIPGPQENFHRALHLYQRERYFKAQEILKDVALNYPGSALIDSVKLYEALTYFQMRDYLTAADDFERIRQVYPQSAIAGEAQFYLALSYFKLSPSFGLDQTYTTKALTEFQRLIEDFPNHRLRPDAQRYIEECRDKLGHKEYASALLYYKLGEYASSVLYSDAVLEDYYDTSWAPAAQLLKAKCYIALKDDQHATEELEKYLVKYPGRKEDAEVRALLANLRSRGQSEP